ncbi:MAG: helix-turn-helix transcriptional regulator [Defluviitaleaceae bacterium]|nr:helix-turn-helix transcriptional regulator [Defluviitaleaceae bacterium]
MFNGAKLRKLRKEAGMSLEQLAQKVGCDHSFIGYIEIGHKQPGIALMARIADYFGIKMDDFRNDLELEEEDSL